MLASGADSCQRVCTSKLRVRVRLIERNYYARILAPRDVVDPAHWMSQLGEDLRLPRFSMPRNEAMARRLRRNYIWLFLILLFAWLLKTTAGVLQATGPPRSFARRASYSRTLRLVTCRAG